MTKAFAIAETEVGAGELCAAARELADSVVLCMVGAPAVTGIADKCIHIDVPADNIVDDAYLSVISAFDAEAADVVLLEPTVRVRSLGGRLAAAKGAAAITGVTAFEGDVATSMYFGGTGVRAARPSGGLGIYEVSAGAFDGSTAIGVDVVEEIPFQPPDAAIIKVSSEELPPSGVDLSAADIVIGCGRGFADRSDLQLARELAGKIGAEVGCTRPLAEGNAWFPREAYIGVSGAMLSPKAYFGIGISGQMQHMVGVSSAGTVFALNKDKNAAIFRQCDYGIVGDLKTVLPDLIAAL